MWFADISAAFLQGDYLPETRRVFMKTPKNYPMFVREYLASMVPQGARTDIFRMKKGGFGLSESPRLWYQRFKRDVEGIGGRELSLAPGVFSFWDPEGQPRAMLAVHVDDVRLVCSQEAEENLWPSLKNLFSFGDWQHPAEFTRFCGRYEKQMEDGTIIVQMDDYVKRVQEPPRRPSSMVNPTLMVNEKKWIGTICGQLNWMARQCRADLMFGVSRVQQLAGIADPTALSELAILVERAKQSRCHVFKKLDCEVKDMMVLGVSDASFGGMPRGRSQGGTVLLLANPMVMQGSAPVVVISYHSGLIKRVVRSSLSAEMSQAATTMEEADFLRAFMADGFEDGL